MTGLGTSQRSIGQPGERHQRAVSVRQREAGGTMRFVRFSSFATASRDHGQLTRCSQTKSARVVMSARGNSVIWYPSTV